MKFKLMLMIALTALVGCNGKPKTETLPPPPQMIKEQAQALDAAKGVNDTLGKQAEEQAKRVEEATK